jgi:hypothetical protein
MPIRGARDLVLDLELGPRRGRKAARGHRAADGIEPRTWRQRGGRISRVAEPDVEPIKARVEISPLGGADHAVAHVAGFDLTTVA